MDWETDKVNICSTVQLEMFSWSSRQHGPLLVLIWNQINQSIYLSIYTIIMLAQNFSIWAYLRRQQNIPVLSIFFWTAWFFCLIILVFPLSSPSGMIEGTPQLHANAWKISSACHMPVNIPVVDPCNVNQQNGTLFIYLEIFNLNFIIVALCFSLLSDVLKHQTIPLSFI